VQVISYSGKHDCGPFLVVYPDGRTEIYQDLFDLPVALRELQRDKARDLTDSCQGTRKVARFC